MIIIGIHDATQNYSMSVLYKQKIYSIELERLIGIKTGIYKSRNNNIFREQYEIGQHTNISKDTLTLGDYGVYLMFKYFSDYLGFSISEIDLLVVSSGKKYVNIFGDKKIIVPESHHLMHLYSSYFLSGFTESNILVIDGAGYNITEKHVDLQSMYIGKGKKIDLIKSNFAQIHKNIGIGIAYDRVSVFLGLTEGKIMGLSGFGQNYTKYDFFEKNDGEVFLRPNLHSVFCDKINFFTYFGLAQEFSEKSYLSEKIIDFVYSFQKEVEDAILYLANYLYEKNNCENLCYAGGVALNCLTNYRLKNELKYKNIFIQPAAGDSGISLGNLLYGYYEYLGNDDQIYLSDINYGLGRTYSKLIETTLNEYLDYIEFEKIENQDDMIDIIGEKLFSKKINIVYRGGSEFGPRALGNRSIISSVNIPDVQYIVNKIKDREYWRPFGMMILKENQDTYFENSMDSNYMLYTNKLSQEGVKIFNNICHNDNTIRLQTITESNKFYFKLLKKLEYYGIKGILNTSLNGKGQAIVETPKQAIEFLLLNEGIENLFIENFKVTRKTDKKFITKKLSNITLIESIINNIKAVAIKKTNISSANIFVDLDIFIKKISINIIDENKLIAKFVFLYNNEKYVLLDDEFYNNSDYQFLISNIMNNTEFLNKLFGVVRGVFIV